MIPKTLAIDFGTKRIGLAISIASLADPLTIISNNDQAIKNIKNLCDQEKVEQILVGVSENEMAEKTKAFAALLQKEIDLPMFFYDETLSSQLVHKKLVEGQIKKSKRQQPIDHYAASEFLQEWLDSNAK